MFKKIVIALAIAVAFPIVASAQKFGTVDAQSLFAAMPETTAAESQLAESSKKYEEEYKKLQEEVDKKYQEFQGLEKTTPDAIKERRMQEIQELAQKADRFRQTASEELQRQQQQLMAPIQQKMVEAIKSVGTEGGFTFIFPVEAALFAGSDVVDATPLVRAKLGIKATAAPAAGK